MLDMKQYQFSHLRGVALKIYLFFINFWSFQFFSYILCVYVFIISCFDACYEELKKKQFHKFYWFRNPVFDSTSYEINQILM